MLKWAAVFFLIAVLLAVFGFGGVAVGGAVGRILFIVFAALCLGFVVYGIATRCCRGRAGPPGRGGLDDQRSSDKERREQLRRQGGMGAE